MQAWLRDGMGSTVSAAIASAFYGGPLVLVLVAGGDAHERPPAALPPMMEAERVAVWLPEEDDGPVEAVAEPVRDAVLAEVDEPEEAVVVPEAADRPAAEEAGGGAAGDAAGTAEVGGAGEGIGRGDGAGAKRGPGEKGARVRKKRRRGGCNRPHPNIREGADGIMEVDRSLVDRYTQSLESFMRLGYSRPYHDEGVKGWYIGGFSCVSPVHKAGFRRGDVLLSVNGRKTRSWIGMFLMYQKLKNKEAFEVQIVRKGRQMTLRFRVVEG